MGCWTIIPSRILLLSKPILTWVMLNWKSVVCVMWGLSMSALHEKKGWILNTDFYPPTHLFTCLPPGFIWNSARASTDWSLQTDAEGDTHSLINWPSRYKAGLTPISPAMLPCSHCAGLTTTHQTVLYEHWFLNHRSGQNPALFPTRTYFLSSSCRVECHWQCGSWADRIPLRFKNPCF